MPSLFLRIFEHLLPRSPVWKLSGSKAITKFFAGLAAVFDDPLPEKSPKAFVDAVWLDAFPATARTPGALEEWEHEFGLVPAASESARRLNLAAEWKSTGGQSPSYIQSVLQTAGFDVYVHDWWSSGPPYVARDPRSYTTRPLIGTVQCTPNALLSIQPQCTAYGLSNAPQSQCNAFLANDTHYLVNKDLTRRPPPPIPDDPAYWPYFLYIAAASFPTHAIVPPSRRAELERLVLKLRPTHLWVVMLVDYIDIFDESFDSTFA